MTNVTITYQKDVIDKLSITGHANFNDAGKDIVCASISTLTFYTINAFDYLKKIDFVKINIDKENQLIEFIKIKNEDMTQNLLKLLVLHLKGLKDQYPKNIIIEEK